MNSRWLAMLTLAACSTQSKPPAVADTTHTPIPTRLTARSAVTLSPTNPCIPEGETQLRVASPVPGQPASVIVSTPVWDAEIRWYVGDTTTGRCLGLLEQTTLARPRINTWGLWVDSAGRGFVRRPVAVGRMTGTVADGVRSIVTLKVP